MSVGTYFGPDACPIFGFFFGLNVHLPKPIISFKINCYYILMHLIMFYITYIDMCGYIFRPRCSSNFRHFFRPWYPPCQTNYFIQNQLLLHFYAFNIIYIDVLVHISAPMLVQFSAFFSVSMSTFPNQLFHLKSIVITFLCI
jgi:hypothetical protein